MTESDWAGLLGAALGAAATAGSVFYAAKQIRLAAEDQRRNEDWRRSDVARALMLRLSSDDELAFCARALDWGVGPLLIPAKYLPLFPADQRIMEHQPGLMAKALSINLPEGWRLPEALAYRYSFDSFFSFLDDLRSYIEGGLIPREQFIGIDYYLKLLRSPPYLPRGADTRVFLNFIERFYTDLLPFVQQKPIAETRTTSMEPRRQSLP